MLHLQHRTPEAWAHRALEDVPRLLADQLSCEYKAAAAGRMMARKFGTVAPRLGTALGALACEEEGHARLVERLQAEHGWAAPPGKAHYTAQLRRAAMGPAAGRLDLLLVSGLIEARSCERFGLLAREARGSLLAGFFEDFLAAEARHLSLFVELALDLYPEDRVRARLAELAQIEARISAEMPLESRMH